MPIEHLQLGSVFGKFPVQTSSDGEGGEEGRDGDGSKAHSKSHQERLCQPPKE